MVQCEMCGTETTSPKTARVEGAELKVCDECVSFGTEVDQGDSESTSTKYSTGSSGSSSGGSGSSSTSTGSRSTGSSSSPGGGSRSDMFDDMDELAHDYDDQIRRAREDRDLSQTDLADELNEKASLIRKLERGETLPSDEIQNKLERFLDVDLSGSSDVEDSEWSSDTSAGETTLGDVVERKD